MSVLPWQTSLWRTLNEAFERDNLPHAMLLTGSPGIGKQALCEHLAATLLCQRAGPDGACGQCAACGYLDAGSHPDFKAAFNEEGSRVIKVDQVRQLIDFVHKTASLGERKVVLLGPAEWLNINAANALLKCLEEPAAGTHLVLFSHRPSALAATIRSRCQHVAVPSPDGDTALSWLDEMTGDRAQSAELLRLSGSQPLRARALFEDAEGGALDSRLALMRALEQLPEGGVTPLAIPALVSALDLSDILALMRSHLESRVKQVSGGGAAVPVQAFEVLDYLGRLHASVERGGNPNRQLTLEDCAGRLAQVL